MASSNWRFGLLGLFGGVGCACLTAAAAVAVGWPAIVVPLSALKIAVVCRSKKGTDCFRGLFLGGVIGVAMFFHAVGCSCAYETVGEVRSGLLHASLALYLLPIIVYLSGRPLSAAVISLVLSLLFGLPQFVWARRLIVVRSEVQEIVEFAEAARCECGQYPHDLAEYQWTDPSSQEYIEYDLSDGNHLMVYFWSGNRHAPHWYSCTSGWGYYPD